MLLAVMVCFFASAAGAICGIGGGIIIKPVLDALRLMDVSLINFMSGCTVLSMSAYSVMKSKKSGNTHIETRIGFPLALGAAAGGVTGRWLFGFALRVFRDKNQVSRSQAACLLALTIGTLLYMLYKERIKTHRVEGGVPCVAIGFFLGILSSFLGIGGGPVNLIVLFFFFSMSAKAAAENSLYIIFFSQLASLFLSILTEELGGVDIRALACMCAGGIAGGICGRAWNKRISERMVEKLFVGLMVVIIGICVYNIYTYS